MNFAEGSKAVASGFFWNGYFESEPYRIMPKRSFPYHGILHPVDDVEIAAPVPSDEPAHIAVGTM